MRGPLLPLACAVAVVAICLHRRRKQRLHLRLLEQPGLIFTGTGCSSGLPLVQCALQQSPSPSGCQSCAVALRRGRGDPNWRGNVGALLRFFNPATGRQLNLQIDCGKTFREVVTMEVYRKFGIKWLDALLLTHDHMDAIGGLDELRSLQMFDKDSREVSSSIRCMCDRRTLSRLRHVVPYLFPKPKRAAGAATAPFDPGLCQCCELDYEGPAREPQAASPDSALPRSCSSSTSAAATGDTAVLATPPVPVPVPVKRFVAKIDWDSWGATAADGQPQDETSTFDLCGLQITALPLQHGADYICFGFGFGPAGGRTVYLSDYTSVLPAAEALLEAWASNGEIALLVLDALRWDEAHPVHATALESVALARKLRPKKTLLVGMGHTMEHVATNRHLRTLLAAEGLDVQLAYDGQFVPLRFF